MIAGDTEKGEFSHLTAVDYIKLRSLRMLHAPQGRFLLNVARLTQWRVPVQDDPSNNL